MALLNPADDLGLGHLLTAWIVRDETWRETLTKTVPHRGGSHVFLPQGLEDVPLERWPRRNTHEIGLFPRSEPMLVMQGQGPERCCISLVGGSNHSHPRIAVRGRLYPSRERDFRAARNAD